MRIYGPNGTTLGTPAGNARRTSSTGFSLPDAAAAPEMMLGMIPSLQTPQWSLQNYREGVKREQKAEAWDELERSVLSQLSDDIRVGVSTGQVSITVYREFI